MGDKRCKRNWEDFVYSNQSLIFVYSYPSTLKVTMLVESDLPNWYIRRSGSNYELVRYMKREIRMDTNQCPYPRRFLVPSTSLGHRS